ncbi:MAG: hypothetical protein ACM3L8_04795 [Verrucomicrobiota bacterium]
MKKNVGIVVTGPFAEQYGKRVPYAADALKGSADATGTARGTLRSVQEIWTAGRQFARQCLAEGLPDRAFRI